jgi:hypothetical protein
LQAFIFKLVGRSTTRAGCIGCAATSLLCGITPRSLGTYSGNIPHKLNSSTRSHLTFILDQIIPCSVGAGTIYAMIVAEATAMSRCRHRSTQSSRTWTHTTRRSARRTAAIASCSGISPACCRRLSTVRLLGWSMASQRYSCPSTSSCRCSALHFILDLA